MVLAHVSDKIITMNLGTIIKELRKEAGLSQKDLAQACGLTQSYLSQIEQNKKEPQISSLRKIAEQLELPFPVLLFLALEDEDIPESKREISRILLPSIKTLIIQLFPEASRLTRV